MYGENYTFCTEYYAIVKLEYIYFVSKTLDLHKTGNLE